MTVEELSSYGLTEMDGEAIRGFLNSRETGVLGLPAPGAPYMIPMSYGYDGGSNLYFTFVVGSDSRKADLMDRAEAAGFLVYEADTPFNWESVLLTGTVRELGPEEWEAVADDVAVRWRPDVFEQASVDVETAVYAFLIDEWNGIRHVGLPPEFPAGDEESG